MHDRPRQALREIVVAYGRPVLRDARRCRALLMDFCPEHRGEINLVEMALREGVAEELASASPHMPQGLLTARLAQRLQDAYYLPDEAARWAVETCAAALEPPDEAPLATESAGATIRSGVAATVHVRPWLGDEEAWEPVGRTPGEIRLPDDGEVRISARLDDGDAAQLASDLAGAAQIHQLDLSYSPLSDAGLGRLAQLDGLVAVNLTRTAVGDAGLQHLGACRALRWLNLWGVETVTDRGVRALGGAEGLEWLELGRCTQVTDRSAGGLRRIQPLGYLGLSATGVTDAALPELGRLPELRSLDLSHTGIDGSGLNHFRALDALVSLDLSGCVNLRPESVARLRGATHLAELDLSRCGLLTDQALMHLRSLSGLRSLSLEGLDITDAGILYLGRLGALTALDLAWTPLSDQGAARLVGLRGLQVLSLAGTPITDASMIHVGSLQGLTTLDLSSTAVTDAGLRSLRSLTSLTHLDLERTRVRDAGLVHLGSMASLVRLYLGGTAVSDVGLALLSRITNLKEIDLTFCSGVTPDGVEMLRSQGVAVSY